MNWIKENKNPIFQWVGIGVIIFGIYSYFHWYIPYRHLQQGYVDVSGFDCPSEHPIKANRKSMIYHVPRSTYYGKTSAASGDCFNTEDNAINQGFRAPFN